MKKLFYFIIAAVFAAGCSEAYDDSALTGRVDNLEDRVSKLEILCSQMNTNISSLQTLVNALSQNDYITNVAPISRNGEEVGYTITFKSGKTITIYHGEDGKDGQDGADGKDGINGENGADGKDGKDGSTPIIGVKKASDNIYYWTLNGEWLLDDDGNKIKAVGTDGKDGQNGADGKDGEDGQDGNDGATGPQGPQGPAGENGADGEDGKDGQNGTDGITPQLKIEEGYWYISYDNGSSWKQLGKATGEDGENGKNGQDGKDGDSFFQNVTQDDEYVYFTLADGTQISILKASAISSIEISYVPRYDDGKATVVFTTAEDSKIEMDFQIMPKSAAAIIAKDWKNTLSLKAVETQTRAVEYIDMPISKCTADATNGTITITASGKNLPQTFFDAETKVRAALFYDSAIGGTVSEYVELDISYLKSFTGYGNLTIAVDDDTTFVRNDFNNGWQNYGEWDGLKSVNGIYQGVKVSWNHTGAYKISKVVINGVEITADGENKWSVDDKFVGAYVVEGLTTSPATIDVEVYSGEKLLGEKSAEIDVYTLPAAGDVVFDVKYDYENCGWKINSTNFSTLQYATWSLSFNVFEKGSNTPVFEKNVTKNVKKENLVYKGWVSRGFFGGYNETMGYTEDISAGTYKSDYDDGCTPEFIGGSTDVFSGLKPNTDYEIRYSLDVWPIVGGRKDSYYNEHDIYYDKILMNSDSDEAWGTRTLEGTYSFTTEAATSDITVVAAAQGYQGAKLTWNGVMEASYYRLAYDHISIDDKIKATEYVIEPETLKDANKYKFTVTAYSADDIAISSATTEDVEIFTMCNYTEPVINFYEVEGGYQVVASNLVQLNYAYAGGATVTLKKDGEVVYVLKNNTGDGIIAAWAGYKRWALNAQDNRKDWKWTVNGTEESNEVRVHAIEDGNYIVEWEWDYVVNKNGKWANHNNGNFIVQDTKDETTGYVYFADGHSDVLWVSSGVPYRVKKSGTMNVVIGGN